LREAILSGDAEALAPAATASHLAGMEGAGRGISANAIAAIERLP